jgi:hypothetical protein
LQANFVWAFVDLAIQQRGDHDPILPPGVGLGPGKSHCSGSRTENLRR